MTAVFNAGGRIIWGSIVDRFSYKVRHLSHNSYEKLPEKSTNLQKNVRLV